MFTEPDVRGKNGRGCTLIEVVVGLAILSLMAGAIYGIVSGSVESFLHRTRVALTHLPGRRCSRLRRLVV